MNPPADQPALKAGEWWGRRALRLPRGQGWRGWVRPGRLGRGRHQVTRHVARGPSRAAAEAPPQTIMPAAGSGPGARTTDVTVTLAGLLVSLSLLHPSVSQAALPGPEFRQCPSVASGRSCSFPLSSAFVVPGGIARVAEGTCLSHLPVPESVSEPVSCSKLAFPCAGQPLTGGGAGGERNVEGQGARGEGPQKWPRGVS